jgi:hypothetical protein
MKSNSNSASIGTNDLAEVSNLFRRLAVSKVKKRLNQNLPGPVQKLLREWLLENQECPFPGKVAQRVLALENKVEVDKIQNWFSNSNIGSWLTV